jgi:CTP synthase
LEKNYNIDIKTFCIMAETKYIFVTGGVASSLGNGVISSSIGKLLQARGYNVTIQKFDPYININPGTLNPNEHGECYVTVDGHEADLDLGHYERFLGVNMTKANNITTGRIYKRVIDRERRGEYHGKTIQVVPHITDEIKRNVKSLGTTSQFDFIITEIGGTVGDIESLPYMESVRQLKFELGRNAMCVHLTYVPYLAAAGELKTKPTQHSVQKLQSLGIQPDVLVLRTEHELSEDLKKKTALFCNVDENAVFQSIDASTIYEVPILLQNQSMDDIILRKFGIEPGPKPKLGPWKEFLDLRAKATEEVHIGLVGKYDLQDAYKSIFEASSQASTYNNRKLKMKFINSENITKENVGEQLAGMDGIIIGPGAGQRGIEGKNIVANYTRVNNIPTFGIGLGMQCMIVEFARNVLGLTDANSREMNETTPNNVVDIMEEAKTHLSDTMRMGNFDCALIDGSKLKEIYGANCIQERHHHRYEFNNKYKEQFEEAGMKCVGINPDTKLVEAVEVAEHPWYIGVQYYPQYNSTVLKPHPLFLAFIKAAIEK